MRRLLGLPAKTLSGLKSDQFYRQTLIFLSASLAASALNYLYYPIMSRLLDVSSYGELQIITSFLLQITTIFIGLNLINVNIVANRENEDVGALTAALQKAIFWIILLLSALLIVLSPALKNFFHFSSVWPFIFIVPALLIDAVSVFWTGYLQGHRDFKSMSFYTIFTASGKLIFSLVLIGLLGVGVSGGPLGIALGLGGSLLAVKFITSHVLPPLSHSIMWPSKNELSLIKGHLVFILEVIFSLIIMSVLLSIDVILVKHFFSPEFAGRYAGIATVSRIIFFASSPIVTVMLPSITLRDPARSKMIFKRTIGLSLAVSLAGLAIFWAFPEQFIRLFLGARFTQSAHWLPQLAVVAILVTITNVVINYLLAKRSHLAIIISLVSLVSTVGLISARHSSVTQIVTSASAGLALGLVVFVVASLANLDKSDLKAKF